MVNLPDEIVESIILAHFGRSPLHTLDIDGEIKRRRFVHRACRVSRQWHRLAGPLLFDSVLFETLNQARAFPIAPNKRLLVRKITVASDLARSGMEKLLRDEGDRFATEEFMRTRLANVVASIAATCFRLLELRGRYYEDIATSFRSGPRPSLVIGGFLDECQWHESLQPTLEREVTRIDDLAVFCDPNLCHGEQPLHFGHNSARRLKRLELGDFEDGFRCYGRPLFDDDAALRQLVICLANYWTDDVCTADLLLGRCKQLEALEIGSLNQEDDDGALSEVAVAEIIDAAPDSLRSLTLDYDCSRTAVTGPFMLSVVQSLDKSLQDHQKAPGLREIVIRTSKPPKPGKSGLNKAFAALVLTAAARGLSIEARKA